MMLHIINKHKNAQGIPFYVRGFIGRSMLNNFVSCNLYISMLVWFIVSNLVRV